MVQLNGLSLAQFENLGELVKNTAHPINQGENSLIL